MIIIYVGYWISICHYNGESNVDETINETTNEELSSELFIIKLTCLRILSKDSIYLDDQKTVLLPNQTLIDINQLEEEIHVYNIDQKKDFELTEEDLLDLYNGKDDKWQEFNDFYEWFMSPVGYKSEYLESRGLYSYLNGHGLYDYYIEGLIQVNKLYHSHTGKYFKDEENSWELKADDLFALEAWGIENIDENLAKEDDDYYMFLLIMGCEKQLEEIEPQTASSLENEERESTTETKTTLFDLLENGELDSTEETKTSLFDLIDKVVNDE